MTPVDVIERAAIILADQMMERGHEVSIDECRHYAALVIVVMQGGTS